MLGAISVSVLSHIILIRIFFISSSPLTTVLIVFMAMFLDGALVTTCVPIIPEVINEIRITNWVTTTSSNLILKFKKIFS